MLAIADDLEHVAGRYIVLRQAEQGVGRPDQGRGMGLEQAEEIALLRQQALKPAEH
jgi:hypothetical protein